METMVLNVKEFPKDLHTEMKVDALKKGILLRDWIRLAVEAQLTSDNKKTRKGA